MWPWAICFDLKKMSNQFSLMFCEGKVLQGFKICLKGIIFQSKV